ncbi:MAG: cyclic nucleotide-binding protein [Caulobacteraceae bacterium]|nr:cyclic nucleotide-binding protein [Caulobacteraceae bacterium]
MAPADLALLRPHLHPTSLTVRQVLEKPNIPIQQVYFPESGLTSVVAHAKNRSIEVGLIGWEGMSGVSVVMGNDRSPNETFIQAAGSGSRISAQELRQAMETSPTLRTCLLHYVQAFLVQTAQTALANGQAKLEERLARWLLMTHDRFEGDAFPITHEFLALMLGVRRPGVTVALHLLEGTGLIRSTRGLLTVLDREGLEEAAGGSYGVAESEYERLIGCFEASAQIA